MKTSIALPIPCAAVPATAPNLTAQSAGNPPGMILQRITSLSHSRVQIYRRLILLLRPTVRSRFVLTCAALAIAAHHAHSAVVVSWELYGRNGYMSGNTLGPHSNPSSLPFFQGVNTTSENIERRGDWDFGILVSSIVQNTTVSGGNVTEARASISVSNPGQLSGSGPFPATLTLEATLTGTVTVGTSSWHDGYFWLGENHINYGEYGYLFVTAPGVHPIDITLTTSVPVSPTGSFLVNYAVTLETWGRVGTTKGDFFNTLTFDSILLPNGQTPESQGMTITFASGAISPNVPEPSSTLLGALGGAGLPGFWRRRKKRESALPDTAPASQRRNQYPGPQKLSCILTLASALLALGSLTLHADIIALNSKATYLHTNSDPSAAFVNPIDLFTLSFAVSAGDFIRLTRLGDFSNGPTRPDSTLPLAAVFSSSTTLPAPANLNRLPNAIDAGTDFFSGNTFAGNQPTDITEDFSIASLDGSMTSLLIQVPVGGRYLFVAAPDTAYGDNTDPDGDFAVAITVPEPATFALSALGFTMLLCSRKAMGKCRSAA